MMQAASLMRQKAVKMMILEYISSLRMMELWFHGAHHLTRGDSFAGDHVNLYGKIYQAIGDQFDPAVEKGIGLFGDECGDPMMITAQATMIMSEYPSPRELPPAGIAAVGLQIEKDFLKFSESIYNALEQSGAMTLGLDDMIMANSNAHEGFVYLLQQRIKHSLGR
jgi:hypothetical protein